MGLTSLQRLLRSEVYKRDGFKCVKCGWTPDTPGLDKWTKACYRGYHTLFGRDRYLTLDHIIPKSKGGRFVTANLQCMCNVCNRKKGDRMPQEVR